MQHDVFLSHNTADKDDVRSIKEKLVGKGVKVWFDEHELRPGDHLRKDLERALKESKTIAVFLGRDGLGSWQEPEMDAALRLQKKKGVPLIPIILPCVADQKDIESKVPLFLQSYRRVNFQNVDDEAALGQLLWAIKGKNPPAEQVSKLLAAITERDAEQLRSLILAGEFVLLSVSESEEDDAESVGALTAEVGEFDVLVAFTSEENAGIFVRGMGELFEDDESVDGVVVEGNALLEYLPDDFGILVDPETEDASVIDPTLAAELLSAAE